MSDQPLDVADMEAVIPRLLRAALRDIPTALTVADVRERLPALMAWAEGQQLIPLVAEGLFRIPGFVGLPEAVPLATRVGSFAAHSAHQTEQAARLSEALEAAGIVHMPLKGSLLKALYPLPEWRLMGDVDILIRPADLPRIRAVLSPMGFTEGRESDHECHFTARDGLHAELHKSLVPTYDTDLYAYFGDGFTRAYPTEGWSYRMTLSPEDTYLYLVAHMAKHYRTGGVGVRYAVDLYVFRRAYTLDEGYLARELAALGLAVFEDCTRRLCAVWFGDATHTPATRRMSRFLFSAGVFGGESRATLSEGARLADSRRGARRRRVMRLLFPDYATMRRRGHTGGRWRLPLWWLGRWGELLTSRRAHCRERLDGLSVLTEEALDAHAAELDAVGLTLPRTRGKRGIFHANRQR